MRFLKGGGTAREVRLCLWCSFRRRGFGRRGFRPGGALGLLLLLPRDFGLAFQDGVGQILRDQFDRPNPVVVAGNRQIDRIGIAVGVDQRHGGDAQLLCLANRVLFLLRMLLLLRFFLFL